MSTLKHEISEKYFEKLPSNARKRHPTENQNSIKYGNISEVVARVLHLDCQGGRGGGSYSCPCSGPYELASTSLCKELSSEIRCNGGTGIFHRLNAAHPLYRQLFKVYWSSVRICRQPNDLGKWKYHVREFPLFQTAVVKFLPIFLFSEDMLLQEDLIQIMPMVNEANAMSEELDQKMSYEIALISPQARGLKEGKTEVSSLRLLNRMREAY